MDCQRNFLEVIIPIVCGDARKKAISCIFRRNTILMISMKNKLCIWFKPTNPLLGICLKDIKAPACKSLSTKTCVPVLFVAEKS